MLSVLIPTYNVVCCNLCKELVKQSENQRFDVEIIVLDDASDNKDSLQENSKINSLNNCKYILLEKRISISAMRNRLAEEAKGELLLFLDSDVFPCSGTFLKDYVEAYLEGSVVVGGLMYRKGGGVNVSPLRYSYGIARECKSARERMKSPYRLFLSSSFLIGAKTFNSVRFDESFDRYGHEDSKFGMDLEKSGIEIVHIDNPVYHDDNDTSERYLAKVRRSIENLILHPEVAEGRSGIVGIYNKVNALGAAWMFRIMFSLFGKMIERNLLGKSPFVFLLDLYKIGYFCKLKKE